ncbi:MAG: hypothetical protein HY691_03080 [Chloroflexi bacterium]|nr:hypothetical protein [Chloroflexota bacterium]
MATIAATASTAPASGAAPRSAPADHSSALPAGGDLEIEEDYVVYRPRLTVADGFRFGCGFMTAVAAFYLVVLIALTLVYLIAVILRLPVPGVPS